MKYEKWSLGYWMVKQYVRFADWIIHNNTIVLNKQNLPRNKPILFTPNHQNALSDPMAILLHTPFQPVWLARADIFKNKIVIAILRFLKIMPVYRIRDGKENLGKNEETFNNSVKVLQNNGALALFPEGAHTGRRQMIAHKKAAPRIVFMAEELARENLNIQIIPAGIYYSSYWKFNRNVIVNLGEPIPANQFLEEYKENPNAAALSMRNKIYEGLKPLVIDIRSKTHYQDFEDITAFYGKRYLYRQNQKYSMVNLFFSNKKLGEKLDELEKDSPEKVKSLVEKSTKYKTLIKKHQLRSWLVEKPDNNIFKIVINKLVLLVSLPIFIFGIVFNAIPFFGIDTIIRKKVKDFAFWSTFFLVLGLIVFPVFYLIELAIIGSLLPGILLKLAFLFSLPIAGKLAFRWYILMLKTFGRGRLFILKLFHRKKYKKLEDAKNQLFSELDNLISV